MARGWESKSIEMQIEERGGPARQGPNALHNAAEIRALELLRLSQARILIELKDIRAPRLRELKLRALTHIENEIKRLTSNNISAGAKDPQ